MLPDTIVSSRPAPVRPSPFMDIFPVPVALQGSAGQWDDRVPWTTEVPACWGLALHPEYTTPGLRLNVRIEGSGAPLMLRAGDQPVMFKKAVTKLAVWPADVDVHRALWNQSNFGPLFVAALALFRQEGTVAQQFAQLATRMFPSVLDHKVLLSGEGRPASFPVAAANTLVLHTGALRRLRLLVYPRSGANLVTPPGDLAATIRGYILNPIMSGAGGAAAQLLTSIEPDHWSLRDPANPLWHPLTNSDFAVTQAKLAQDYAVELGGVVAFRVESLAGTGVDRLAVTVTGA